MQCKKSSVSFDKGESMLTMASNKDFEFEFEILLLDLKKGRKEDLQLTVELGKAVLERNKELEAIAKQKKKQIDDHLLEIEYLNKHNTALREVNESRLECYENLELSILELEQTIEKLTTEVSSLRKENKTLLINAGTSESRCDELSRQIEELTKQYKNEKRRNDRIVQEQTKRDEMKRIELLKPKMNVSLPCDVDKYNPLLYPLPSEDIFTVEHLSRPNATSSVDSDEIDVSLPFSEDNEKNEEFLRVLDELEGKKRQCVSEQNRVTEIEEQLHVAIKDNNALRSRLDQVTTQGETKSMHDELSILDEVRFGKMCVRCLRNPNDDEDYDKVGDDDFPIDVSEDGVNQSNEMVNKTYHSSVTIQPSTLDISLHDVELSPNPYHKLEQKYEALFEIQRQPILTRQSTLQDELIFDDFISIDSKGTDGDRSRLIKAYDTRLGEKLLRIQTDLSKPEKSRSVEIKTKSTQTDENLVYADDENKTMCIHDDVAMPMNSRPCNRVECRKLFQKMFSILKTAENEDECKKLPLSDNNNQCLKTPPIKPDIESGTKSIISSVILEQSTTMPEFITNNERQSIIGTDKKNFQKESQENKPPIGRLVLPEDRVMTPSKWEPLQYIAVSVSLRRNNPRNTQGPYLDRCESPFVPTPFKINFHSSIKKRRDFPSIQYNSLDTACNGTYNKTMQSSSASSNNSSFQSSQVGKAAEFRRNRTASQDIYKLRQLELSMLKCLEELTPRTIIGNR